MDKQALKAAIVKSLKEIGVVCIENTTADLTVETEFVDAKWSTGEKKIQFHNSAYFDESALVLYYWESTVDRGSGFSFGGESETSFQSGMTLMRKVKSVQFTADGKTVEYNLDLGGITKIYKEEAKKAGWKFKVVLKKEKAMFPEGAHGIQSGASVHTEVSAPLDTVEHLRPAEEPTSQVYAQPKEVHHPEENPSVQIPKPFKKQKWFFIPIVVVALLYALFFGVASVSLVGWILGALVIGGTLTLQNKFANKGCLAAIGLWVVALMVLVVVLAFTAK